MGTEKPYAISKVGIALAAYKPSAAFVEQLASLQGQTWKEWICVITCDSSLEEVLAEPSFAAFKGDPRFVWVQNERQLGTKRNFEKAIRLCAAEEIQAIACADQDDVWYPKKLERSVRELERRGRRALVHCDMRLLRDGQRSERTAWEIERRGVWNTRPQHLLVRNVVAGCAMLFDVELARAYPEIPAGFDYHDHWFAYVAACHGGVHPIFEALYDYRQHGGNELGVTPYKSLLGIPARGGSAGLVQLCRSKWRWSRGMAESARAAGLFPGGPWAAVFLARWDFGLGFLLWGIAALAGDRALARACFARAAGKGASVAALLVGKG